jgi:MATE family multidrug resistance protein
MSHNAIENSFAGIMRVSLPMILTVLSSNLMLVVDRAILAGYSLNAVYASTVCGTMSAIASWMFVGIASTSEVFVGQYNGGKEYDKLAIPVWQMIYMSAMSIVFFLPLGYFSEYINFLPDYAAKDGVAYQTPLLYFGFLPGLIAALSAFFVGQGKTATITYVTIMANVFNAASSYYCVYNLNMGAAGASISTVLSQVVQVLTLALVFFNKNNRLTFGTLKNRGFNKKMFYECFRIGAPLSICNFAMILAWYVVALVAGHASRDVGIVWGISGSIHMLTSFFPEGLSRAIAAITSNMIGQRDLEGIKSVYRKFIILAMIIATLFSIPMVFFPDMSFAVLNISAEDISKFRDQLIPMLVLDFLILIPEATEFVTWGVLVSGGDTKYPTLVSQVSLWGFLVVPTAALYYFDGLSSVATICCFIMLSYIASSILMFRRYRSLKWYKAIV